MCGKAFRYGVEAEDGEEEVLIGVDGLVFCWDIGGVDQVVEILVFFRGVLEAIRRLRLKELLERLEGKIYREMPMCSGLYVRIFE